MDLGIVGTVAEVIGVIGGAYLGGVKGGRRAFRELEERVDYLYDFLVQRSGMPPMPPRKERA